MVFTLQNASQWNIMRRLQNQNRLNRITNELVNQTKFSRSEVWKLYREFIKLNPSQIHDRSSGLSSLQFLELFRLSRCVNEQFSANFINLFWLHRTLNKTVEIHFEDFVKLLSEWTRGTTDQRLALLFQLYDKNRKGYIVKEDIQAFLEALLKTTIEEKAFYTNFNTQEFRARVVIDSYNDQCQESIYKNIIPQITSNIIRKFHHGDGAELLWFDEFKNWALLIPGVALALSD